MYPPERGWTARAPGVEAGRKSVLSLRDCVLAKYTDALPEVKLRPAALRPLHLCIAGGEQAIPEAITDNEIRCANWRHASVIRALAAGTTGPRLLARGHIRTMRESLQRREAASPDLGSTHLHRRVLALLLYRHA